MPKLPSLQQLFHGFVSVIKRFPFEILASVIGTIAAMIMVEKEHEYTIDQIQIYTRILLCSTLALTLFLSVSVYVEQQKLSWKKSVLLRVPSVLLIISFYFLLHPIDNTANIFRYGFLFVAFHLLVSFSPFIRTHQLAAFWEYNKRLFLRILTAGLYSSVLYAGLSIAIVSTDVLFSLDIDGKIYAHLASFIFGIFNTAFFLAGVPADWTALEEEQTYPKGLKIFTQFVLIPLAIIYLTILLTYEGKVAVEWSLPKGIVSTLVLGYAVYGILSILLVHPIRHQEENKWIKTFSNLFYFLLIPLIVLLCVAIWARIQQYGITEPRYIVIILSVWLIGITAYYLITRSENMKVIPVSLCILSLACTWGPQSASSVSKHSQLQRLLTFFEKHHGLSDGKLISLDNSKKNNDGWDGVSFIIERYGTRTLQPYLSVNVDSLTHDADTLKSKYDREYQRIDVIRKYLNLKYEYNSPHDNQWHSFESTQDTIPISGYAFMKQFYYYGYANSDFPLKWDSLQQTLTVNKKDSVVFEMKNAIQTIRIYPNRKEQISVVSTDGNVNLIMTYFSFTSTDSVNIQLESIRGYILFKKPQ